MTQSLLPVALALVLVASGGAAMLLRVDPKGSQAPAVRLSLSQVAGDDRPSAALTAAELEERVAAARAAAWSSGLPAEHRAQLRQQIAADREELRRRAAEEKALVDSIRLPTVAAKPPASGAVPAQTATLANEKQREKLRLKELRRRGQALRAGPLASGVAERRKRPGEWPGPAEPRERDSR